ncbi:hypothetical protein M0804_006154 [Polistes exclamans]|nr:hypothetical protein M0804_006154 [Polistes exclamans]
MRENPKNISRVAAQFTRVALSWYSGKDREEERVPCSSCTFEKSMALITKCFYSYLHCSSSTVTKVQVASTQVQYNQERPKFRLSGVQRNRPSMVRDRGANISVSSVPYRYTRQFPCGTTPGHSLRSASQIITGA